MMLGGTRLRITRDASWWVRTTCMVAAGVVLGFASASAVVSWGLMQKYAWPGIDLDIMLELGHRWRETGTMYLPYQVSSPYFVAAIASDLAQTPGLYPPAAGPLFALLAFVPRPLLTAAWWIVPVAAVAWSIRDWRPAPWAWLVMAACLAWPLSMMVVVAGRGPGDRRGLLASVTASCKRIAPCGRWRRDRGRWLSRQKRCRPVDDPEPRGRERRVRLYRAADAGVSELHHSPHADEPPSPVPGLVYGSVTRNQSQPRISSALTFASFDR